MQLTEARTVQPVPRWRGMIKLGVLWGVFVPMLGVIMEPTAENIALGAAILLSGLYTVCLYRTRRWWRPLLVRRPLRYAVIMGVVNAAGLETLFWFCQLVTGAEGIAAHPNLFVDLLLTMPWYAALVVSLVRVQHRRRFGWPAVLLLGALYEAGADGLVAQMVAVPFGESQLFQVGFWVQIAVFSFWSFVLVYSSIVLPPCWLIETIPPPSPKPQSPAWRDALRPLWWLLPFTGYVLLSILALMVLGWV